MRKTPVVSCLLLAVALPARGQIVDHSAIDAVLELPQCVMDGIGTQRWFFTHASVGGNLLEGLDDLATANPARFQLATAGVGYDGAHLRADPPPLPTVAGTVYECGRGNPGWEDKFTIFDNSVRLAGWRQGAVDAVMDKLCYIDPNANVTTYLAMMDALAMAYPTTALVLTTMPLTVDEDGDNVLRNLYNQAVRAHAASTGALLYDIADMEAHDPDGVEHTFVYGGQTYQKLFAGYTGDGGHLDLELGHRRVAQGWYAAAAALAPCWVFADGFESGATTAWSATAP